jgi:hypothetical protein
VTVVPDPTGADVLVPPNTPPDTDVLIWIEDSSDPPEKLGVYARAL